MKKILAIIMTLSMLAGTTVYATDYSAQLTELQGLLEQCENQKISVPYEKIGVETFKRFKTYLAEDETDGVSEDIMTYNNSAMQTLYSNTKANLEAYLSGTKNSPKIPVYDMMKTSVSGKGITDGKNNIISTGYGHFETVQNDIENLHNFGMMNMQMEVGPNAVIAIPDWSYSTKNSPEYYFDVVETEGNRALKVVYNSDYAEDKYFRIRKTVKVTPSTKYYYKFSYKGTNVSSNALSVKVKNGKLSDETVSSVSSEWQDTGWKWFTTGSGDTSVLFEIYVSNRCTELLIDNVILKKGTSGDNLLENGDFENLYSQSKVSEIQNTLERAKQSNVAVSFLLQPLNFWRIPGCADMYLTAAGTAYNVNDTRAKAKVEQYLRTIVPILDESSAVRDICITNEPELDTRKYPDFYNPKFRQYLLDLYGSLSTINSKYGTSYGNINSITMPTEYAKTAIFYDWLCFNEDQLTEWNAWMASIIKEYTNKPVHCKIQYYFLPEEQEDRDYLIRGADVEKFDSFCDLAGNDAASSIGSPKLRTKMMWYDYLSSVTGKPIYNSEDHFISDGNTTYDERQKNTVRYNLWQGAIHGRTISTMWVWERSFDSSSSLANSILTRPDCVAEAGYTSLDMMRFADDITKLSSKQPDVALFYSKTSRVFNDYHMGSLATYYTALLYSGKRIGFVTESSLDKLSNYSYLIIPAVSHTTPEAITAVNNFISNGGKVFIYDKWGEAKGCMQYDKFGKALSNSNIKSKGTLISSINATTIRETLESQFSSDKVKLKDSSGAIVSGVEYEYYNNGGTTIVNMVKLGTGTQTVSVYLNGTKLSGMKNILTGEVTGNSHELTGYVPLTLKYSTDTPSIPQNLTYIDDVLSWDKDDKAISYNVYYTPKNGSERLYIATDETYCNGCGAGVYRVVGINSLGTVGDSAQMTVTFDLEISFDEVNVAGNSTSVAVNVRNVANRIKRAVIKIKTDEGKIAVNDITIAPLSDIVFKANFGGIANRITASVGSSYQNQNMSVTYDVSE